MSTVDWISRHSSRPTTAAAAADQAVKFSPSTTTLVRGTSAAMDVDTLYPADQRSYHQLVPRLVMLPSPPPIPQAMALLESVHDDLFPHVAKFLSFDQKRHLLTHLSHTIASKLPLCYRHDTLVLELRSDQSSAMLDRTLHRLAYTGVVGSLQCQLHDFDSNDSQHTAIVAAIISAVATSGRLRMLAVYEGVMIENHSPIVDLLKHVSKMGVNTSIESLTFHCYDSRYIDYFEPIHPHYDWMALATFRGLSSFEYWHFIPAKVIQELTLVFPTTLKRLKIPAKLEQHQIAAWVSALGHTSFAPNLEEFLVGKEFDRWCGRGIEPLATTIMMQSHSIRPLRSLSCTITAAQVPLLANFVLLETLSLYWTRGSMGEIGSMASTAMPRLASFTAVIGPNHKLDDDLPMVLEFLSSRPVTSLSVQSDTNELQCCFDSLNHRALKALAAMKRLQSFKLNGESDGINRVPLAKEFAITALTPSCWARVDELSIARLKISKSQLTSLLLAAPIIVSLELTHGGNDVDATSLPFIAHHCPSLRRLKLVSASGHSRVVTLRQLQQALQQFPARSFFRHLAYLDIDCPDDAALHYLLAQLQSAPLTSLVLHPPPASPFSVCLQRSLPQLESVSFENESQAQRIYRTTEQSLAPRSPSVRKHSTSQQPFTRSDVGNGKAAFFHALYHSLSEEERERLTSWDAGDYDWQGPVSFWEGESRLSPLQTEQPQPEKRGRKYSTREKCCVCS